MPDIAIIGERTFLYEKLFQDLKASYQFLSPGILGSPFLPQYRMVLIPAGFANPEYSQTLLALQRTKSNIARFIENGGVLTVFGPLLAEHSYDWLPLPLRYKCAFSSQKVAISREDCSCLICTTTPECDGYMIPGEGFETVAEDDQGRAILVAARYGEGLIVATSVHEFPAAEYIKWALDKARPSRI